MGVEREYKFDVDPDWSAPDLTGPAGGVEDLADEHLRSTYFDTVDRRLWAAGITLRHRATGGQQTGKWTLKLPVPDDAGDDRASVRTEIEGKGPLGEVPAEVRDAMAATVGDAALEELAVLESVRRRRRLGPSPAWAEVDDDAVTVTSGPRRGLRFRQLEVELLSDPPAGALDAVLSALAAAGAAPGGASKIGLAAGLTAPGS